MSASRTLAGIAIGLALISAACTGSSPGPSPAPSSVPAHNATTAATLPTDATELPDITPEIYDQLLTELRGTPVVVNFWGSWCGPCRVEAPMLEEAASTYGDDVQFIGVDLMDTRNSAIGFMGEAGWDYPSFFDPSPGGDVRSDLGYVGQPVTIVYDTDGQIVGERTGQMPDGWLDEQLAKVASGSSQGS